MYGWLLCILSGSGDRFFFFPSCISQHQKLASFDYSNAHVIGNTWLMSVLIQQCLKIPAFDLFKLNFEIFAFRTLCYFLVFFVVWLFWIFRQNIVPEWKGNVETHSGCLTVMIVVVRTPAAAPAQMKVRRRLLLCHPVSQLSRTMGRFILILMANLAWVSMCCVSARGWVLMDFSLCWVVRVPSQMLVSTEKRPKQLKGWGWLVLEGGIVWVLLNWNKRGFESWWWGRNGMGSSALCQMHSLHSMCVFSCALVLFLELSGRCQCILSIPGHTFFLPFRLRIERV